MIKVITAPTKPSKMRAYIWSHNLSIEDVDRHLSIAYSTFDGKLKDSRQISKDDERAIKTAVKLCLRDKKRGDK